MSATAAIGLRDVSLGGVPFGSGRLDVGVTDRDLTAALEFPAMGLSATGHGRLEEGRTVTAQARLERTNLDPIVARLAPAARGRVLGRVSARAEAEVPLWRPGEMRMTASITPDELVVAGGRWTTRSPAVIRWDRGRLTVDQFRAEGPPGTITASAVMEAGGSDARIAIGLEQARLPPPFDRATPGEVRGEARLTRTGLEAVSIRGRWPVGTVSLDGRVPFEGPIALRSRLMADVAEVARALGQDRVAGQAIVSADLSGSWREPVATGRIEATALTSAEVTLTGVTVPFRVTPSTIRIADARAVLGKDPLALEGEASWATERVARTGNADGPGPDGGRLADRGAPRRLPGGPRAARGDRRVHPRSRRGRAGDGVVAVERGRSSGGPARTGRAGGAPRGPPGPRPGRLGVGTPRGRVPVSRGRHRLAGAPIRRGPRRG